MTGSAGGAAWRRVAGVSAAMLALASGGLHAQVPESRRRAVTPSDEAERAVAEALRLQKAGSGQRAKTRLEGAMRTCPAGAGGRECRAVVGYHLAQIEPEPTGEEGLRARIQAYEKVLDDAPAYSPAVRDLVLDYRRLGAPLEAVPRIRGAIDADPSQAGALSLVLGDLYASQGDWPEARRSYEAASTAEPSSQSARSRLLMLYRLSPDAGPRDLSEQAREWEEESPAVARDAYAWLMARSYRDDSRAADEALVRWTLLGAVQGSIRLEGLAALPEGWDSAAVQGLRDYLEEPRREPEPGNWWLADPSRRDVLARVALALGRDPKVTKGEPAWSARCWTSGMALAPGYEDYFGGALATSVTRLRLATALAELYHEHPELDPGFRRFGEIERDLFADKTLAYHTRDLRAIQSSHEALGRIYARRGIWRPEDHPNREALREVGIDIRYANALFQLEHALDTAGRRDATDGTYQPLPEIRGLLADGYTATGEPAAARAAQLAAATALLDVEEWEAAEGRLESLRERAGVPSAGEEEAVAALESLLSVHRRLGDGSLARDAARDPDGVRQRLALLFAPETVGSLPGAFLRRQWFRLAADLATVASGFEPAAEPVVRSAWAAWALAAVAPEGRRADRGPFPLVGTADLVRVRRCQSILQGSLGSHASRAEVRSRDTRAGPGVLVLEASLVTGKDRAHVWLARDALVTAHIVTAVGAPQLIGSGAALTIEDGDVAVTLPGGERPDWVASIERVAGVRTVRVN